MRWHVSAILLGSLLLVLSFGCKPLQVNDLSQRVVASNYRDWSPQFARLPYATAEPSGQIRLRNVRNNLYLAENDFVPQYYDRHIEIDDVRTVDFIVVPFQGHEYMAHTMLSFGLVDGSYLGVSAEIRTEKGEEYSPVLGLSNQYELTYVVADERDIIRLRTRHRDADVYLYHTVATPEQSQALFLDVMERVNQLAQKPEFYHTVSNNCTTNILKHVNRIRQQRLSYNWRVLLPGYSAEYAYEQGMLDTSVPFEELKERAWINDLAERHFDDPLFSRQIRFR
ncbi:MAG: Lnb N-terminal periplasmic domain-containing protein [Pirellulaceae bacterium]